LASRFTRRKSLFSKLGPTSPMLSPHKQGTNNTGTSDMSISRGKSADRRVDSSRKETEEFRLNSKRRTESIFGSVEPG